MIKVEIETRLSSDVDLKNMASMMNQGLVSDINLLKENVEAQNKKFA